METEPLNIPWRRRRKLQSRLEGAPLDWEEIQTDWGRGRFEPCLEALRPETGLAKLSVDLGAQLRAGMSGAEDRLGKQTGEC